MLIIYKDVKSTCREAQREYQQDCVNSLIKLVKSDDKTYRQKNRAIWALGQLSDKRALPLLQDLYIGEVPHKEPLDLTISQYEVSKAKKWCENGNATSWMYRNQNTW